MTVIEHSNGVTEILEPLSAEDFKRAVEDWKASK